MHVSLFSCLLIIKFPTITTRNYISNYVLFKTNYIAKHGTTLIIELIKNTVEFWERALLFNVFMTFISFILLLRIASLDFYCGRM